MNASDIITIRRLFHKHPELSGFESATAARIVDYLEGMNVDIVHSGIGGHGLIAVFDSGRKGPEVLFRADMDALPIREDNAFEYRSVVPDVAHLCGHDGHMSILLGLASYLSEKKPLKGKAILLFQPSEENGKGAAKVLDDKVFKEYNPDYVFGLHNIPAYPLNSIITSDSCFSMASSGVVYKLHGKSSHAAYPELGINPSSAVARILSFTESLEEKDHKNRLVALSTVINVSVGQPAFGTSASDAELMFTLRAENDSLLESMIKRLDNYLDKISREYRLEWEKMLKEPFPATINEQDVVAIIDAIARENCLKVHKLDSPFRWSEDFGHFLKKYKGAFFGIGSGMDHPGLHTPNYDFPDDILETAIKMFSEISEHFLF